MPSLRLALAFWCFGGLPAWAAHAPDDPALAEAVRLGAVAALAPLCGLRDDAWAEDVRRAEMQAATGTPGASDPALRVAPGSDRAASALGYAEAEALEDFAEAPAEATCGPLATNADLGRADDAVRRFRERKSAVPGS